MIAGFNPQRSSLRIHAFNCFCQLTNYIMPMFFARLFVQFAMAATAIPSRSRCALSTTSKHES